MKSIRTSTKETWYLKKNIFNEIERFHKRSVGTQLRINNVKKPSVFFVLDKNVLTVAYIILIIGNRIK